MSECGTIVTNNNDEPQVEFIGDETTAFSLDVADTRIKRVCILTIDPNYTIEAVYGDSSTSSITEGKQQHTLIYPHDTEEVLKKLDPNINVQTIYLVPNVRKSIAAIRQLKHEIDVFINLYDNSDDTATKIIEYMQNQGIAFTGASRHFCDPTRIELKRQCRYNQLPTPKFGLLTSLNNQHNVLEQLSKQLGGFPLFVKPEHGYDSLGITEQSLVHNLTDLQERCAKVFDEFGGALIEEYIEGREFTVLVAGTRDSIHVFPPVEYNFSSNKTFITFEDKWGENFTDSHWHFLNEEKGPEEQILIDDLMLLAKQLYESFNGDGYARIDIRQDNKTKQLLILDCNPNCSVFYKYSCSADLIMQSGDWSREKFMKFILEQGLERRRQYHLKHACVVKYSLQNGYGTYASRNLLEGDLAYTNEHRSFQLITKKYAEQTLNKNEMICFNNNAWPICDNVYILWHEDSEQWQPINHSCDPNIWMDGLHYIARRSIGIGEELTMDYSTFTNTPENFVCRCGTSLCRGQLKSNEYKKKWFQDRYGSHLNPYILMLIEIEKLKTNN